MNQTWTWHTEKRGRDQGKGGGKGIVLPCKVIWQILKFKIYPIRYTLGLEDYTLRWILSKVQIWWHTGLGEGSNTSDENLVGLQGIEPHFKLKKDDDILRVPITPCFSNIKYHKVRPARVQFKDTKAETISQIGTVSRLRVNSRRCHIYFGQNKVNPNRLVRSTGIHLRSMYTLFTYNDIRWLQSTNN